MLLPAFFTGAAFAVACFGALFPAAFLFGAVFSDVLPPAVFFTAVFFFGAAFFFGVLLVFFFSVAAVAVFFFGAVFFFDVLFVSFSLAAAASVVQGETDQGTPVVWAQGVALKRAADGSSRDLLRERKQDMFR